MKSRHDRVHSSLGTLSPATAPMFWGHTQGLTPRRGEVLFQPLSNLYQQMVEINILVNPGNRWTRLGLGGTTRGCQALVEHVSMIDFWTLSIYANSLNSYLFLYANTHSNMQIHGFYQPKVGQTWSGGSYDSLEQVYTIKLRKYHWFKIAILHRADFQSTQIW